MRDSFMGIGFCLIILFATIGAFWWIAAHTWALLTISSIMVACIMGGFVYVMIPKVRRWKKRPKPIDLAFERAKRMQS